MTDGRAPARGELPMCRAVVDVVCGFPRSNVLNGDESDVCAYGIYQSVLLRGGAALGPELPFIEASIAAIKPHQTGHSLQPHHRRPAEVRDQSEGPCIQATGRLRKGNLWPVFFSNAAFAFPKAAPIRSSISAKVEADGFRTATQFIQP